MHNKVSEKNPFLCRKYLQFQKRAFKMIKKKDSWSVSFNKTRRTSILFINYFSYWKYLEFFGLLLTSLLLTTCAIMNKDFFLYFLLLKERWNSEIVFCLLGTIKLIILKMATLVLKMILELHWLGSKQEFFRVFSVIWISFWLMVMRCKPNNWCLYEMCTRLKWAKLEWKNIWKP